MVGLYSCRRALCRTVGWRATERNLVVTGRRAVRRLHVVLAARVYGVPACPRQPWASIWLNLPGLPVRRAGGRDGCRLHHPFLRLHRDVLRSRSDLGLPPSRWAAWPARPAD